MLVIAALLLQILAQISVLPFSLLMFRLWDAAVRRRQPIPDLAADPVSRFSVLVPAHNEEPSIAATVESLKAVAYPRSLLEIIVIADNCQDATAERARQAGATVLERFDQDKKSKDFALEYALQHLQKRSDPPDAIVIIDADSTVDRQLFTAFDRRLQSGQDWLQAYYTVANPDDGWRTQMMSYAFAHFNAVWLLGQDALGLGSALRGNGMAFSWRGLTRTPWQAYGLAEDLEFSWRLRLAAEKVHFVPEVKVYGEMIANNQAATASQRLRWEHGRRQLRQTFASAIRQSSQSWAKKFLLLSDLFMPSLAAYSSRLLLTVISAAGLFALDVDPLPGLIPEILLALALLQLLNLLIYVWMPFTLAKLPWRYLKALALAPLYMLWKASLLLRRAPTAWVRTARNASKDK